MAQEKSPAADAVQQQDRRDYGHNHELPCIPEGTSQYQLLLQKFAGSLEEAAATATSALNNAKVNAEKSNAALGADRKGNEKLRKASREYDFLNNCITNYAEQDIALLQETAAAGKKNFETLTATFSTVVTRIAVAKQKQSALYSLATKLREAVNESGNSEECKQIEDCLSKTASDRQKGLSATVHEIVRRADMLNNSTDDLSEAAVKVTAINGFINAGSLTTFADGVKTTGADLIKDVADNLKKLLTDYENSRKQLGTSAVASSGAMVQQYSAVSSQAGLNATIRFVNTGNCRDITDNLDRLADDAEKLFIGTDEERENSDEEEG